MDGLAMHQMQETQPEMVPNWISAQRNLKSFSFMNAFLDAERFSLMLDALSALVKANEREFTFNFTQG